MFTEKGLITKIRGLNMGNNQKNNFQQECYCRGNADLHKKDSPFDAARREMLSTTYFGAPKDKTNHLEQHTKMADEASLMKTYNSVSNNIAALHDIGQRNWSAADFSMDRTVSQVMFKPRTAKTPDVPRGPVPFTSQANTMGAKGKRDTRTAASMYGSRMVRVFSPKYSCYIETPASLENESQKLTYLSMKSANNFNSVKVCGGKGTISAGKPFEGVADRIYNSKPYTVSAETFQASWVDRGRPQTTTNYESAKFNIISHSNGQNETVTKLMAKNPKACYKVKSIGEYCDLSRVSAIKLNEEYQNKFRSTPTCFLKAGSLCAKQCDFAKTYGPFYKMFNK